MLEPSEFSGQAPFPRPTACIGMEEKSLDSAFWTVQSFARQPQTPQYEEVASAQMVSARRHKQHLPRPLKGKTERSLNLFQADREKSTKRCPGPCGDVRCQRYLRLAFGGCRSPPLM